MAAPTPLSLCPVASCKQIRLEVKFPFLNTLRSVWKIQKVVLYPRCFSLEEHVLEREC